MPANPQDYLLPQDQLRILSPDRKRQSQPQPQFSSKPQTRRILSTLQSQESVFPRSSHPVFLNQISSSNIKYDSAQLDLELAEQHLARGFPQATEECLEEEMNIMDEPFFSLSSIGAIEYNNEGLFTNRHRHLFEQNASVDTSQQSPRSSGAPLQESLFLIRDNVKQLQQLVGDGSMLNTERLFQESPNKRFQYHQRVLTHRTVNNALVFSDQVPLLQDIQALTPVQSKNKKSFVAKDRIVVPVMQFENQSIIQPLRTNQTQSIIQVVSGRDTMAQNQRPDIPSKTIYAKDPNLNLPQDISSSTCRFSLPPSEQHSGRNAVRQNSIVNLAHLKEGLPISSRPSISQEPGFIDFRRFSHLNQSDLSNKIYNTIKEAPPYSTIQLPDKHIILPCVVMKHPMHIVGSAGTILEIVNGNIICDFRELHGSVDESSDTYPFVGKCVLSQMSLIFKCDPQRIYERVKEHVQKAHLLQEKCSYSETCLQYFKVHRNLLTLPLIVVEDASFLEVRDCYLRSIRKDSQRSNPENFNLQMEEVALWVHGNRLFEDRHSSPTNSALLKVQSCIFYNFFDQMRAGVNSSIAIEKCHFSEPRNNAVRVVNPKILKIKTSTFSKPTMEGVLCEWLQKSQWTAKARRVEIEGNEFYGAGKEGIAILTQVTFAAHNLKIIINKNKIAKCSMDGILVQNLALNDLQICDNDCQLNLLSGIHIKDVHQKSNKFKFRLAGNKCFQSEKGYGIQLKDAGGFTVEGCECAENKLAGFYSDQAFKPMQILAEEVEQFLKKWPMNLVLSECEFRGNGKNGCHVAEHWKGMVRVKNCKFLENEENGLELAVTDFGQQQQQQANKEAQLKQNYHQSISSTTALMQSFNKKRPTPKNNQIQPLIEDQSMPPPRLGSTQKLKKAEFPLKELGSTLIEKCQFIQNKQSGIYMSKVMTFVQSCTFSGNEQFAICLPNKEDMLYFLPGGDARKSLLNAIGGPWGMAFLEKKQKKCFTCGLCTKKKL